MNVLTAENITKAYSERVLLDHASFSLQEGEKVGVIGVNGMGKSTLLRIVAGAEEPDEGTVITGNSVKIGYLPQEPEFREGETVLSAALRGTLRNREDAMKLFATHAPRAGWAGPRHALPECAALRNSAFVPLCTFTQRAGAIRFTRRAGAAAGFGSKAGKRTVFARFQTTAAVQAAPEHKRGATCNQNSISSIFTPITTRTAA